jgi:outer membrane protein insertion porin family
VFVLMLAVQAAAQQASVIRDIVIRGNRRVLNDVILSVMRTKVGQPYIQENLDRDKRSIEDLGFFSAVDVRATPLEQGNYTVTVDVEEFPEIKEIRVTGNSVLKTEEILNAVTLKPGQVYNLNALKPSSDAVRELYAKKGFFGQIEEFAPLKESPGTINLVVVELRVGTVSVQGNARTKDWVMRRLIKTRSGEAFSGPKWTNDLRRLYNTGWFEKIDPVEDTERELGKIDLGVNVKEARTGSFNVGLQIDPRSSLAGVLRLTESNLRGTGQTVGIDFLQTTRGGGASLGLDYVNPFYDAKDTQFRASVYSRLIYRFAGAFGSDAPLADNNDYRERRTGGSLGFTRPLTDYLSVGLSGRFESVTTGRLPRVLLAGGDTPNDPTDDVVGEDNNFIRQDGDIGVLSLSGTLNRRDTDIDPSRGDFLRADIEPGYSRITRVSGLNNQGILGSNLFTRNTLEYRRYFSDQPPRGRQEPDAPRRVLALRARYGVIAGNVPFFEQYFAGGSETIRGYEEDRFWGKQTLLTTLEYRYPLQRAFNVIGFVDYGGAWGGYGTVRDFTQSLRPDLHLGYGLGLSFRTPLGPIRLDLGFNENGKSRTHFLIGTSF